MVSPPGPEKRVILENNKTRGKPAALPGAIFSSKCFSSNQNFRLDSQVFEHGETVGGCEIVWAHQRKQRVMQKERKRQKR
jgi:hypothetical protein